VADRVPAVAPTDLREGATGEAVRDLQLRLAAVGHDCAPDDFGTLGPATVAAVRSFQEQRRLLVDGVCGRETWAALVESGFSLGDRLLYYRRPMVRGDDVADLQRRLNDLGFDAGREDGIFGTQTGAALTDFERNAGLAADGICGPAATAALARLGTLAAGSVATVRERDQLRRERRQLSGMRVYVNAAPGFEALGEAVMRGLVDATAEAVLDVSGEDETVVADIANRFSADLFLALRAGADHACSCAYFSSGRFRSEAGYRVAAAVRQELSDVLPTAAEPSGKAYSVLRETRMAAVACELVERGDIDGMRRLVANAGAISRAIVRGVRRGVEEPLT
jgi:N-acetylmuramoyl-L-alanine amidase